MIAEISKEFNLFFKNLVAEKFLWAKIWQSDFGHVWKVSN